LFASILACGLGLAGLFLGAVGWVLRLIENVLPFCRQWPFGRRISGFPSWGMAAVDGLTAFALPADLLSAAVGRRKRTPRGFAPGPLENGQRTPAYGLQSNPPPCLSWAVGSTFVCAERFLARPLGMGSGGGGDDGTLAFCSHLCPSGRFRPPLSWPYSVFPTAVGNESLRD
jgi:hypothetical protein